MTKRRQTSDGRVMTQPELQINEGSLSPDTVFTISGTSPWGSTSKYNVVLNGPDSYYTYKAAQLETDENGDEIRSWVTKTGNDPQRLARYRSYVKEGEKANDYMSGWEDFLRAIGLKKKDGGWLEKFQDGGTTQQQSVSPEQDVMNTIDAAIGEIQTKRPGQAVQKLAAMMQDPNYSMIIDMIKQEYPQIEGILNTVEQMVGTYKCGGKAKKKVKKGAKGCVPCKKLMKVGGKLINVWTDCEGNIISKHQAGGWLIPKGYNGLLTDKLVADKYRTVNTGTATEGAEHYYIADDGSLRRQYAVANNNNGFDWAYENLNQNLNHEGFNKWLSGAINSDTGERTGGVSDFWANGVNYNNGAITFNDETTAKGILGEEEYNKGTITGNSVHGVSKSGNTWLGDKVEDLNVTAQDYVQHHGGWQNAMQAEDDILKAKRRASRKLARYQRQNMRDQFRDFDSTEQGSAQLDLNGDGTVGAGETFTNRRAARQAIRNARQGYMKEARQARTTNQTAILGTLAPQRGTVSQNSLKMQTSGGNTTLPTNDVIGFKDKTQPSASIRNSRVINGVKEYNVDGSWVSEDKVTPNQIASFNNSTISSKTFDPTIKPDLTIKSYSISSNGIIKPITEQQKKAAQHTIAVEKNARTHGNTLGQKYSPAFTENPVLQQGGWLTKF